MKILEYRKEAENFASQVPDFNTKNLWLQFVRTLPEEAKLEDVKAAFSRLPANQQAALRDAMAGFSQSVVKARQTHARQQEPAQSYSVEGLAHRLVGSLLEEWSEVKPGHFTIEASNLGITNQECPKCGSNLEADCKGSMKYDESGEARFWDGSCRCGANITIYND